MYLIDTLIFNSKSEKKQYQRIFSKKLNDINIETYTFYTSNLFFNSRGDKWNLLCVIDLSKYNRDIINTIPLTKNVTIRRECMELTPNAHVKSLKSLKCNLNIVEHVDVADKYLEEFQSIMIQNNIPAMTEIIHKRSWCNEFIALETRNIIYHKSKFPKWNQIHLISLNLKGVLLFKKDFSTVLKTHSNISFEQNFSRLKKIRVFTYKANASKTKNILSNTHSMDGNSQ